MIKINLLPKTLNQKAALRNTAILFGVVLIALIAAGVGYSMKLQGDVDKEKVLAEETIAYEARVKAIQAERDKLKADMAPTLAKLKFINDVLKYNLEYPALYEKVARWTYEKAVLDAVSSDGTNVTVQGRVKNLDDLGRYLLNMYCATDLFTEVRITQASGFGAKGETVNQSAPAGPMGTEISGSHATNAGIEAISASLSKPLPGQGTTWIGFTAVCKLKTPLVAPTPPGGAAPSQPGAPAPAAPMPDSAPPGAPSVPGRMPDGDINPMGG
jgi:Tfp pilus assembly protein PilN